MFDITLPEQTRHLNFRLSPRRFCVERDGGAGTRLATYRALAPWEGLLAPRHRRVLNLRCRETFLPRLPSLVCCARLAGTGVPSSVGDFGVGDGGVGGGDNAAAEVAVVSGARAGERARERRWRVLGRCGVVSRSAGRLHFFFSSLPLPLPVPL